MRDVWMREAAALALVVAFALPAHASAPGGGGAPKAGQPVVAIDAALQVRVGTPLPLSATIGGAPAAGRVAWAVGPQDAARARLVGDRLVATTPGDVGVSARAAAGTAWALVAVTDGRAMPLAAGPGSIEAGSRGRARGGAYARHGAPTGHWLVRDARRLGEVWRATFGPGGAPPAVDFATRSVVAAVAYFDGEDAAITHVVPGRPATVHLTLAQRRDANAVAGPAAPGAPQAYFWTIPRLAGPAQLQVHVLVGEETYPLR